ncbi:MAG: threonine transporter [Corynebacterium urealyticum]|uniref:Threonine transporter n=1 Tax=Corynebacterium urealyticum TaxID=43771 RepID=A0A2W5AXL1_9CORY|nr:MAG: threonine transporter [Corynebacterium urealyticum]
MAVSALAALMGVWFAAMASPGPDVVQIIRLGARSTRAAVWAAIGSTTGLVVWTVASLAGLSALISATPQILVALQVLGGAYLLWMAYTSISSGVAERRAPATVVGTEHRAPQPRGFSPDGIIKAGTAYRMGLVCDLSNPKVVIFFGAIFANFIDPGMGLGANALVGSVLILESFLIFVGVALSTRAVSKWMARHSSMVDIVGGGIFLLLGVVILIEGFRGVLAL